jgi:hypothetical protein
VPEPEEDRPASQPGPHLVLDPGIEHLAEEGVVVYDG